MTSKESDNANNNTTEKKDEKSTLKLKCKGGVNASQREGIVLTVAEAKLIARKELNKFKNSKTDPLVNAIWGIFAHPHLKIKTCKEHILAFIHNIWGSIFNKQYDYGVEYGIKFSDTAGENDDSNDDDEEEIDII